MSWDNELLVGIIEGLQGRLTLGSGLFGLQTRFLDSVERQILENQGNWCAHWEDIKVSLDFDPTLVHGNRFLGKVILGCSVTGGIWNSTLEDCEIDKGAMVDRVTLLRRTMVLKNAQLRGCEVNCSQPTVYSLGGEFKAGLETPGREVPLSSEATMEEFILALHSKDLQEKIKTINKAITWEYSVIGESSILEGGGYDQVFVGPGSRCSRVMELKNTCLISTLEEPVIIGPGVLVRDSVLQWGVHLDSGAQIYSSVLLEYSGAERQALVTHSLLGPNTSVGEGEVTASLLGPFVGMHHQSLVIAAYWPQGGGNIGYGANVGSNHTGRVPDQEIRPGEGQFFGLGVNVKFPCDFSLSPYTLVATGVTLSPQRMELPFSLILAGDNPVENRVIPGWALSENLYALFRNRKKYLSRDKARRQSFALDPFRPSIVDNVWKTWEKLGELCGKEFYTQKDWSGIGANRLSEKDRIFALSSYENLLRFVGLFEKVLSYRENRGSDLLLQVVFKHFHPENKGVNRVFTAFMEIFDIIIQGVEKSRSRDTERGRTIISDYEEFHPSLEKDPVIQELREELVAWADWGDREFSRV